jgi:DNA-binding response OmpR family regulator
MITQIRPISPREKRALLTAHLSVLRQQQQQQQQQQQSQGHFRLDFTLGGALATKCTVATLLLQQTVT